MDETNNEDGDFVEHHELYDYSELDNKGRPASLFLESEDIRVKLIEHFKFKYSQGEVEWPNSTRLRMALFTQDSDEALVPEEFNSS